MKEGRFMSNNYAMCINRIQAFAKSQGITMKFLCDCLGKRRSFLTEVKAGKDKLDDDEIVVIARNLHTTPEYLRGETDDPSVPESDWTAEIKKDPRKESLMKRLAEMDVETLLKIEKIIDMLEGE